MMRKIQKIKNSQKQGKQVIKKKILKIIYLIKIKQSYKIKNLMIKKLVQIKIFFDKFIIQPNKMLIFIL